MTAHEHDVVYLPDDTDPDFEPVEHPGPPTEAEADQGHAVYLAVDDLDDQSDGITA